MRKTIWTSLKDLHSILNPANVKTNVKDLLKFKTILKSWESDKIWTKNSSSEKSLLFKNGGKRWWKLRLSRYFCWKAYKQAKALKVRKNRSQKRTLQLQWTFLLPRAFNSMMKFVSVRTRISCFRQKMKKWVCLRIKTKLSDKRNFYMKKSSQTYSTKRKSPRMISKTKWLWFKDNMKNNLKTSWIFTSSLSSGQGPKIILRSNQAKKILKLFKAKTKVQFQKNKAKQGKKRAHTTRLRKTSHKKMKFPWRFTKLATRSHQKCKTTLNKQKKPESLRKSQMILSVRSTVRRPMNWESNILKILSPIHPMINHRIRCFRLQIFKSLSPKYCLTIMGLSSPMHISSKCFNVIFLFNSKNTKRMKW